MSSRGELRLSVQPRPWSEPSGITQLAVSSLRARGSGGGNSPPAFSYAPVHICLILMRSGVTGDQPGVTGDETGMTGNRTYVTGPVNWSR